MNEQERIDQVMKALGAAEMPAGMEARVMARIAAVRTTRGTSGFGWMWGAAVAAALSVAVGMAMHERKRVEGPVVAGNVSNQRGVASQRTVSGPGLKPLNTAGPVFVGLKPQGAEARSPDLRGRGGAAERDVAIESFPAPLEPLTEQEKLLVRVVRNGDRNDDFELLNPEAVEVAFAEETAEMAELVRQGRQAPMNGEFLK